MAADDEVAEAEAEAEEHELPSKLQVDIVPLAAARWWDLGISDEGAAGCNRDPSHSVKFIISIWELLASVCICC